MLGRMSKARLVITAVILEGRTQAEVARTYGVSEGWVIQAHRPLPRRGRGRVRTPVPTTAHHPDRDPTRHRRPDPPAPQQAHTAGLDAGPDTIAWHLHQHHHITVSGPPSAAT